MRSMMARACGRGADEGEGGLRLAGDGDELLDGLDDRLDRLVGELEGLDEALLGKLVGAALDHQHVLLVADVDQVERGGEHLLDRRVGDELAVDEADARGRDRPVPRDVGDGEGGAGAVHHGDVGLVLLVGRHQDADDLDLVQEALGEEGAAGAVAQAGGQDLLLGGASLALEVAAREAAGRVVLLAVVDGEGKPVLAGLGGGGDGGGDEDVGLADRDVDGAVGELGEGAGGERDPVLGDRDDVFLIHVLDFCFLVRLGSRSGGGRGAGIYGVPPGARAGRAFVGLDTRLERFPFGAPALVRPAANGNVPVLCRVS